MARGYSTAAGGLLLVGAGVLTLLVLLNTGREVPDSSATAVAPKQFSFYRELTKPIDKLPAPHAPDIPAPVQAGNAGRDVATADPESARYYLQVGAFGSEQAAQAARAQWAAGGHAARIETTSSDGRSVYRVRIDMPDKAAAVSLQSDLSRHGQPSLIGMRQ